MYKCKEISQKEEYSIKIQLFIVPFAKVIHILSAKTNLLMPYHSRMYVRNVKIFAHKSPKDYVFAYLALLFIVPFVAIF